MGEGADLSQDMSYMCALTRPEVQGEEEGDPALPQSVTPPSPTPFRSRELEEDVLKHQGGEGGVGEGVGEGGSGSEGSGGERSEESEEEIEEVLSLLALLVQKYTY